MQAAFAIDPQPVRPGSANWAGDRLEEHALHRGFREGTGSAGGSHRLVLRFAALPQESTSKNYAGTATFKVGQRWRSEEFARQVDSLLRDPLDAALCHGHLEAAQVQQILDDTVAYPSRFTDPQLVGWYLAS